VFKQHAVNKIPTAQLTGDQGLFPAGTPGNGVPKVMLTVGTAFPGTAFPGTK